MGFSFDLLTAPWVKCLLGGHVQRLGLLDLLGRSHEINAVADPSPTVRFAVYRLLLAIVHWASPAATVEDWRLLWRAGRLPDEFRARLQQRASGLFDLFNPKRPFYQDASARARETRPVSDLAIEMPTCTNIQHFHHAQDVEATFCPACCATGLVQLPPFCPWGGQGKSSSLNGPMPPVYFMPRSRSVFHTLMLNLPVVEAAWDGPPHASATDEPAWVGTTRGPDPVGLLEGLTWQPRRTRLVPEDAAGGRCTRCGEASDVLVRRIWFVGGRSMTREARPWRDPHAATTGSGKPLVHSQAFRTGGNMWREAARLALLCEPGSIHAPPALALARTHRRGLGPAEEPGTHVSAYTMATAGNAKCFLWHATRWPLGLRSWEERAVQSKLASALDVTEAAAKTLEGEAMRAFERHAEAAFRRLLAAGLQGESALGEALAPFVCEVECLAKGAFQAAQSQRYAPTLRDWSKSVADRTLFRLGVAPSLVSDRYHRKVDKSLSRGEDHASDAPS